MPFVMGVDLLHLLRNLRRSPASAVAAVLTLSLTLGAGASIFSVVDAVLLTPPPFANPAALVIVGEVPLDDPAEAPRAVGYRTFEAWRERAGSLAAIEAFDGTNFTLTGLGAAERVSGTNITSGFLALLGVTPALGRSFDPSDEGTPVALVSHAFWRGRLGADPDAIGREIVLGGRAHTIVGVLPERFYFSLNDCDVWRPFPVSADQAVRQGYRVRVMARLAGQASAADLGAALTDVSRTSAPSARAVATPVAAAITGDARRMLGILAGAAVLALVVAFTNLAGLLTVRSIDRRRELAIRTALGAGRGEITRQLLIEAEALVAIGVAAGVVLAVWITPLVGRLALQQFGGVLSRDVDVSWRVIAVVSIVASACACLCGLVPAFLSLRENAADALRRGRTPPPRERRFRRAFVVGEVALAFVLLVSMALLGRSLIAVLGVNPGFDARGVMSLSVSLPSASYPNDGRIANFYSTLQGALEERLGHGTTSLVDEIPLTGDRGRSVVRMNPADDGAEAVMRTAAIGYFDVMRIPVLAGRSFESGDSAAAPLRIVLSELLAARLFAGQDPIGRQVFLSAASRPAEVVGVAGDVRQRALDGNDSPTVYLPALQLPSLSNIVVVRSQRPEADVIAVVREEVARLDRDLPVYAMRSMADVVGASPGIPERRVLTIAFTGFAALAVVLGALGLFGVAAHEVASRRAELALRMALGADPMRILGVIVGQAALMVGSGLAAGSVLSIWTSRALGGVVFGIGRYDALSITAAIAVVAAAGALAVFPAARRAARTDPLIALRSDL